MMRYDICDRFMTIGNGIKKTRNVKKESDDIMKKMLSLLGVVVLLTSLFVACRSIEEQPYVEVPNAERPNARASNLQALYEYLTFEEALLRFPPTDVVIAQFVEQRPFGESLTEFEFVVSDRILGNAADRIFIYAERRDACVMGGTVRYIPGDLTFAPETDYLLPLIGARTPYSLTHDDSFSVIRNIVIDLDNLTNSIMYSEPLAEHTEVLNLNSRSLSRYAIIDFVEELTRGNAPGRDFIRSEAIEDIVHGSPNIWVVEINEPRRLNAEAVTDWMRTDIYHVTVTQVLKGDGAVAAGEEVVMIFFADTVLPGEQHIVAVDSLREGGSSSYSFTSRDSLFRMDQLDEILGILG